MSEFIAGLDEFLADAGEDVILRRVTGTAPSQTNVDVTCRARVTAVSTLQIAAGIPATELNVIMSPTQINQAQWPGASAPGTPPFKVDPRIPRAGVTDKILMRGLPPKAITFCDPQIVGGELVRINMRVTG